MQKGNKLLEFYKNRIVSLIVWKKEIELLPIIVSFVNNETKKKEYVEIEEQMTTEMAKCTNDFNKYKQPTLQRISNIQKQYRDAQRVSKRQDSLQELINNVYKSSYQLSTTKRGFLPGMGSYMCDIPCSPSIYEKGLQKAADTITGVLNEGLEDCTKLPRNVQQLRIELQQKETEYSSRMDYLLTKGQSRVAALINLVKKGMTSSTIWPPKFWVTLSAEISQQPNFLTAFTGEFMAAWINISPTTVPPSMTKQSKESRIHQHEKADTDEKGGQVEKLMKVMRKTEKRKRTWEEQPQRQSLAVEPKSQESIYRPFTALQRAWFHKAVTAHAQKSTTPVASAPAASDDFEEVPRLSLSPLTPSLDDAAPVTADAWTVLGNKKDTVWQRFPLFICF